MWLWLPAAVTEQCCSWNLQPREQGHVTMPKIRCFLAIELDSGIHSVIASLVDSMAPMAPGVKWVVPENLHLTLKFFADIDETSTWEIFKAVRSSIGDLPPFQIRLEGVGAFPADDRPRTVWLLSLIHI